MDEDEEKRRDGLEGERQASHVQAEHERQLSYRIWEGHARIRQEEVSSRAGSSSLPARLPADGHARDHPQSRRVFAGNEAGTWPARICGSSAYTHA